MNPEDREQLERTVMLTEDNNRMIKKLYRAMRWARVFRILYLLLIVAVSFGLYYYIQPYLEFFGEAFINIRDTVLNISGGGSGVN